MGHGTFCTAINCMDGRIQEIVISYLKNEFGVDHVDMITEPGPNKIVAEQAPAALIDSIAARINISLELHGSTQIAITGHEDCGGNPVDKDTHLSQLREAVAALHAAYPGKTVLALWVQLDGTVEKVA